MREWIGVSVVDLAFVMTLVPVGIVAGFLAGLLGIGGGIVTVPVMFVIFDQLAIPHEWKMHVCVATSLGAIIFTNFVSSWAHNRKGALDWSIVRLWWWLVMIGGIVGTQFAQAVSGDMLLYIFVTLVLLFSIRMFIPSHLFVAQGTIKTGPIYKIPPFLIGMVSTLMGIGGGALSVPTLTMMGVPVHRAVATSSAIGLVASIAGAFAFALGTPPATPDLTVPGLLGFLHLPTVVILAATAALMAPLGAHVAHKLPKMVLSILFGLFILAGVAKMLASQ